MGRGLYVYHMILKTLHQPIGRRVHRSRILKHVDGRSVSGCTIGMDFKNCLENIAIRSFPIFHSSDLTNLTNKSNAGCKLS